MELMVQPQFKHIYGPVYSWRIGNSLGIDPITTAKKICNFNCTYCQLGCVGSADLVTEEQVFVPTADLMDEIKALDVQTPIDYFTFSGNGEPTLATNLGEMIRQLRFLRSEKIAVITNGTLLGKKSVQSDLRTVDLVLVKLDAGQEQFLQKVNRPAPGITLVSIVSGIKAFKAGFGGRLALQMMFVEANKAQAPLLADLAQGINPDEVQLNTPLRPNEQKPLSREDMKAIKKYFSGLNVRMVYEEEKKEYHPFDDKATMRRHGQYKSV